jgi:hypothetical protein
LRGRNLLAETSGTAGRRKLVLRVAHCCCRPHLTKSCLRTN